MKGMKQIQPIVTKKRVDGTQKRSKHDLIDNNDEGYLTAITHLDPIEPIDEDTFDMYSALTRRIMKFMNKSHNDALDYEEFKVAMSMSGVNVVESRVLSLFSAVHFGEQNQLNFTDFETALMIHDCCPPSSSHHSVFDIFSSFDLDNCGQLTFEQFKECVNSICFQWGSNPKDSEYLAFLFCKAVPSPLERLNYKSFTQLWSGKLADKKVFLGLGSSKQVTRKVKHPTLRKLTSFVLSSWRWVKRKELLQKEITKPGFDMIITFHEMRKQVVERRLEAQKLFHHNRHIIKEAKSKHKRKGVVSASRRKKDLSLILRDEGAKTLAMLEENRILRDKILKELQGLKHNVDIFNHSSVRTKIHEEIQHSYTSMEDKLILRDIRLSEVPLSLYNDKISQLRLSDLKIIDLSGNRLVHLPETNFFFHLISVRKLCLSRNNLATIPDEIGLMNRVEIILVEGNLLNQLPPRISNLENLQVLDLSNNRVNELQDDLCHLPSLKVLSLHSNNITLISHLIGKLTTLCSIDLSNNKIKYIPETFCSLARLIKINISNNVLLELPFQFGSLEGLEDLNISFNNIHQLPDSFSKLQNLRLINADQNKMEKVGDYIGGLNCLSSFEGKANNFESISKKLGSMHILTRLSIPINQIKEIPIEIGLLKCLAHLNLHNNAIQSIPIEIGALEKLLSLDLSNNSIFTIPHEICLAKSLVWVDLSHNALTELPHHFGSLEKLKILKLTNNKLTQMPSTFYQLDQIQELDLSMNYLEKIQSDLCTGLVALQVANFASNRIDYLPQEICSMPTLKDLNLRHNKLKALPIGLVNSSVNIQVDHNPMEGLPFQYSRDVDKKSHQSLSGYTKHDIDSFMKQEDLLFNPATDEWNVKKSLYLTGQLGVCDYIDNVIWRHDSFYPSQNTVKIEKNNESLIRRLKQFYFYCKKFGNPPQYIALDIKTLDKRTSDASLLVNYRMTQSNHAKETHMKRKAEEDGIYFGNLFKRCEQAQDRIKEVQHEKRLVKIEETKTLLDEVANRVNDLNRLEEQKEISQRQIIAKENERLNAISFQTYCNKKRFLPVEVKTCWNSHDG